MTRVCLVTDTDTLTFRLRRIIGYEQGLVIDTLMHHTLTFFKRGRHVATTTIA